MQLQAFVEHAIGKVGRPELGLGGRDRVEFAFRMELDAASMKGRAASTSAAISAA